MRPVLIFCGRTGAPAFRLFVPINICSGISAIPQPRSNTAAVLSHLGFLQWEIRVAFLGESQLRHSRATQPTVHGGCFRVFKIYWTLTWTTGSFTCAQMLTYALTHGGVVDKIVGKETVTELFVTSRTLRSTICISRQRTMNINLNRRNRKLISYF